MRSAESGYELCPVRDGVSTFPPGPFNHFADPLLGDIAITTPDLDLHRILLRRGQRIVAGCAEHLRKEELEEMRRRLGTLEELTA